VLPSVERKKSSHRAGMPPLQKWPAEDGAACRAQKNRLAFLVPSPLLGRDGLKWLRSVSADFALVTLNWLLIGALLVPLRSLFPQVWVFRYAEGSPIFLIGIALLNASLITLVGYSEGLYSNEVNSRTQAQRLANAVLWPTIMLTLAYGMQGLPWARTGLLCCAGVLHFGALWAWRWQGSQAKWRSREMGRNVLIVGAGSVGQQVAAHLRSDTEQERTVCGLLDNELTPGAGVVGRVSDLPRLARARFVDEVILAAPRDRALTLSVLREARRLRLDVGIVPDLCGCQAETEIRTVAGLPLITLHSEWAPTATLAMKRALDVFASGLALVVLLPAFAAIAALIKFDSEGPVFYAALRVGRKAQPFRCYKFRTMVANADELKMALRRSNERSGPFFKIASDPRITRVGKFLRQYSLDELPQLWNVLKGEMSLVGPRPHPLDDFAEYQTEHMSRLDVTPGITGLWQVTARRDPSFGRGMELDREYIRTWSLRLDLQILLKTVWAVICGGGE